MTLKYTNNRYNKVCAVYGAHFFVGNEQAKLYNVL